MVQIITATVRMLHKSVAKWPHLEISSLKSIQRHIPGIDGFASIEYRRWRLPALRRHRYSAGMDSGDLTDKQIAALQGAVARRLRFLGRLRQRMDHLGFRQDDPLYRATSKAYDAVHELRVLSIYLKPGDRSQPDTTMARQIMPGS